MSEEKEPLVVVADDDPNTLRLLRKQLGSWGFRVHCAQDRTQMMQHLSSEEPALLLLDVRYGDCDGVELLRELTRKYPTLAVAMLTAYGTIDSAVAAIKWGAIDYLTKPPDFDKVKSVVQYAAERQELVKEAESLKRQIDPFALSRPIWGDSMAMRRVRDLVATVAPTNATVLVTGESGTGKELVARAIHEQSRRAGGPFVPVNLTTIPHELMESALFGHAKGAFTGASEAREGCCETANHGTLFLDEVAELAPSLQPKLLRFLQDRTIQRVGSPKATPMDVRIVAATNRDPQAEIAVGRLREDLFYRLNVVPIHLPPLRERREDIALLATLFLQRAASRYDRQVRGFTSSAMDVLQSYNWPGNARQLENLVERLVIFCQKPEIEFEDIPVEFVAERKSISIIRATDLGHTPPPALPAPPQHIETDDMRTIDQMEKRAIEDALTKTKGHVGEAANLIGLGQSTVYRKIKRYNINPREFTNAN